MLSMVRICFFFMINVFIERLIYRYYEGLGGKRDIIRKEKWKVVWDDCKGFV